jgi:arylsulfatase A-like enzyme
LGPEVLSEVVGVALTMRQTLLALAVTALLAGCESSPEIKEATPATPPKRIVLVTIDTWRTDALSASGSGRVETPNLDAFAKGGLYCPKAWSSATLTAPSHATLLTGLQPYHHGVRDNHGFRLGDSARTLAALLREKGYATAAFVSAHPLARVSGLDGGFTVYDDRCSPGDPLSVVPRSRPGSETIEAASTWLRSAPLRFFLWVHLYEPHDPYTPPEPFRAAYREAPYFGEVAYADELVGRLKAALGAAGEKDALWIITGDHGEALQDHGESTHSLFVYDQTARVPLIFWAPGSIPAAQREFARLVDVTPTVLALAGLPQPAGLDGYPLVVPESAQASQPAYVETMYPYLNFGAAPVRALTDGRYKVIDVPEREIYDLSVDPAEAKNLAGQGPQPQAEALRTALLALPGAPPMPSQKTGGDDVKALRSLGYIGSGNEYPLGRSGIDPKAFAPLYRKINAVRDLCAERRFTEAVPMYVELLSAFPRSSELFCELGLVELALGKTAESESHLRLALARNPENSPALLGMANLAIGRRDYKRAEGHLLDALALDPDDLEANFDLGALYFQSLGEPAKAVPYWKRFVELQPTDREAPRIRGLLSAIEAAPAKSE